jgi:eukaryotic-like serine/threonine-protein kinase
MDTLPAQIGRFQIRRELGRGMMGVVYEALDPALHRSVALKVIRLAFATSKEERDAFERRFMTEARAAAGLSHVGIVVVHEVGRDPETGLLYLALEHLPGRTLAEQIAEGARLPEREALHLVERVAQALHYAHERGIVHRDIKPANIMVLPDGQPKILDFGLAKLEAGHELTAAGQFMGTPLFMSPEQAGGEAVDRRSDLFSLGAILYTLLAGRRPFEAENVARILARVAHQPPSPLRETAPSVSGDAEYVVMRALQKEPARRYSTAAAMAEDLADVRGGRPPRHRSDHAAVSVGEGTVVARRVATRSLRRAVLLTLFLAGLALYYLSVSGPDRLAETVADFVTAPLGTSSAAHPLQSEDLPSPGSTPTGDLMTPAAEPATPGLADRAGALPEPEAEPPLASARGASEELGDPTTTPSPSAPSKEVAPILLPDADEAGSEAPAPVWDPKAPPSEEPLLPKPPPSPRSGPAVAASPPPSAALAIDLEHPVTKGTVRVWLDGQLVLREALTSAITRKILFFVYRSGRVQETLRVNAGVHRLRVEVHGAGTADAGEASLHFKPGAQRRLLIRPGTKPGTLAFEWR